MFQQLLNNIDRETNALQAIPAHDESDALFLQAIILSARTLEETAARKLGTVIRENKDVRDLMMARAATPKTEGGKG